MNKILKISPHTCFLLFLISRSALALTGKEVQLFTATSDGIQGTLTVSLLVEEDFTVKGFRYTTAKGEVNDFDLALISDEIVLFETSDQKVASLFSQDFDPAHGGHMTLKYLHDGLSGLYRNFDFELDRQGQTWVIYVNDQAGRRSFQTLFLKTKKIFGQMIGIDKIIPK